ncbi:MAG: squalene/phytoene synthase family protein [Pseudomonadota bacterium]
MAEPSLGAPAALVQRYDPDLFATALFAAEPGRGRLMTLYAADVELSRAVRAARKPETGPIIAAMRIQWWRDVAASAQAGAPPPAHEIAGPFADLVGTERLPPVALEAWFDAHEAEISGDFDAGAFALWAHGRFGARLELATAVIDGDGAPDPLQQAFGLGCGMALALRTSMAMAQDGRSVLPDLKASERGLLASGDVPQPLTSKLRAYADRGLVALAEARCLSRRLPRAMVPALLPGWAAGWCLHRIAKASVGADLAATTPPGRRAACLLWAALTGRW